MLDELDREFERRGHRYVRYADDSNIYVRSERAGQRVMESITRFITQKLKLKVNETKSAVARPQERKFLGFSFTDGPEIKRTIAPKALERFKHRIREVTLRAKGVSLETTIAELASYLRGWRSYFGFCETPHVLIQLTRWVRLRLRAAMWRQWKTPRRRRASCAENIARIWVHPHRYWCDWRADRLHSRCTMLNPITAASLSGFSKIIIAIISCFGTYTLSQRPSKALG